MNIKLFNGRKNVDVSAKIEGAANVKAVNQETEAVNKDQKVTDQATEEDIKIEQVREWKRIRSFLDHILFKSTGSIE